MFLDCSPVVLAVPVKICTKCGEVKPLEMFHKDNRLKSGYRAECKACNCHRQRTRYGVKSTELKEYQRKYRAENHDSVLEKKRQYRKNNSEKVLEQERLSRSRNHTKIRERKQRAYVANHEKEVARSKRYYAENSDRFRAWQRFYYAANAETIRERNRLYRANNLSVKKAADHRRRARKLELPDTLTTSDWQSTLDHFGGCCAVCGRQPGLWHTLAADHWIPLSKGGGTTADNIIPLCHGIGGCNNSKADRDADDWLIDKFGPRKGRAILRLIEAYLESRK